MNHLLMLKIINLWSIGAPAMLIAHTLGCSKENVFKTLKILRQRNIYLKYINTFGSIGGADVVVEIDETKIGKNKYHRGKPVKGFWCFGMVERTEKRRIMLFHIDKRNKSTLLPLILRYINANSIIYSDMWKVYHNLKIYFNNHFMVNHSISFKNYETNVHTNTIEGNWRSLKASIPIRCRTRTLSSLYLVRYMITRNERGIPIFNLLKYCLYFIFII